MVAVNSLSSLDVTVGVGHCIAPLLAVSVNAFAHTARRVLYGDVKLTNSDVAFLIVAGLGLCRGRFGVHLCRCGLDCALHSGRGLRLRLCLYCFGCCSAII